MVNGVWGCAPVSFCRCHAHGKPLLASTFHIHCVSLALSLSRSLTLLLAHSLCRSGQRRDAKTKSTPVKGERFWRANPAKRSQLQQRLRLRRRLRQRRHLASIHLAKPTTRMGTRVEVERRTGNRERGMGLGVSRFVTIFHFVLLALLVCVIVCGLPTSSHSDSLFLSLPSSLTLPISLSLALGTSLIIF